LIVNHEFVRRYFAGEQAIGKHIRFHVTDGSGEIIGVVGDVMEGSVDSQPTPTVYQIHEPLGYTAMIFVVRSDGHPLTLVEPIRQLVVRLDPSVPVSSVRTMEGILGSPAELSESASRGRGGRAKALRHTPRSGAAGSRSRASSRG
jgi:hypothetical protein